MNINHRSKGFPLIRLYTFLMALLFPGLCLPVDTYASALKKAAEVSLSGKPNRISLAAPNNMKMQRVAEQSDGGISLSLMCNQVSEETYNEDREIYLTIDDNYLWWWNSPDNIIYEASQVVLNYTSQNPYFGFFVENNAPYIEAFKILLDPAKTNNANVRAIWEDSEYGNTCYLDSQMVADYDNNVIYWINESQDRVDNILFVVESGEINMIGFEIYSIGRTPDDFLSGMGIYRVAAPRFNPGSCNFFNPLTIEISADEGCSVYYRTDGSDPTVKDEDRYQGPIVISNSTTIKAIAADANGNTSSIVSQKYTCTRHGIGEGYDPSTPGNPGTGEEEIPEKRYHLTVVTNPVGAGSSYANNYDLKAGSEAYVYTYNNTGFDFKNWTIEGEEVSSEIGFYYVMPDYDVTIVANYEYNPNSPGNPSPEEQKVKHPVMVRAIPSVAASVSPSGAFDMEENTSREVYAYPNTGWKLTSWTINGEEQATTDTRLSVTMGEKALDIAVYFTYQPTSPSNPSANYYNPTTGQMIIDDFTPGRLYDAIVSLVEYNYKDVSSLIVKGRMSNDDIGCLRNLTNAGTVDLSRTGELTDVPAYSFRSMGASSILLPSTITNMGYRAFQNCGNLTSITIYANVPPACDANTFDQFTNKENCVIYVPKESLELYQNAETWKDFTILPIMNDAHVLQVNLPADAADGRYKHYSIELVNLSSGVRQKYVITDRLVYTFNGLQKDEQYTAYLFSQSGFEIGRVEEIVIPDSDIEVTFDDLKTLRTVFAKILDKEGADVTGQVSVEWLKPLEDGSTTYLRKASSVSEIPEGESLLCRVGLDSKLGTIYVNPEDVKFTVKNTDNTCTVTLVPFRTISLSGSVVDGDGSALSGASVSASQTLNGKYAKTYTAKTDRKGEWALSVLDVPLTALTFAATECVNVNDTIGAFAQDVVSLDHGKTMMKSIVGARVSYGFTYHAAGEEEVLEYYPDYQNVTVSVFNETQNRAHNEVSVQYPLLAVLDENINAGDILKLTATSKTGAFKAIEETVTVGDDQRAEVTFDIVGKGGITASFGMTENPAVTAMLYSEKGELVKKQAYSEAKTTFTGLEDGSYTLVSMGQSDLMNSILRMANYAEIGLTEGKDYVVNAVKVESGKLTEVKNQEIPAFDESVFYYTNSNTNFSTNKSSITTGNYLTLRAAIDFKGVYKNDIRNVALVVDLPEVCDFVEQSVIQGPNLLPYTFDNNRLTVQLGDNYQNQTKFCVVPTTGGDFNASASIVFDYNGKTIVQPIGSAGSEIKNLDFYAPAIITSETFIVNGMAPGGSRIEIYEDGFLIGDGRALSNGHWSAECKIPATYNFTSHDIYAIVNTEEGVILKSETLTVELDRNSSEPKNVHMTFYNGWLKRNVDVTFDFVNYSIDNPNYMFYTTTKITFVADFTNNSPEVLSNVILWTLSSDNTETALPMTYDEVSRKWIASHDYDYYHAPRNIALEYSVMGEPVYERKQIADFIEEHQAVIIDNLKEREQFIAEFDAEVPEDEVTKRLSDLFAEDETNEEEIRQLLGMGTEISENPIIGMSDEEFEALCKQADDSWTDWVNNGSQEMRETALNDFFADPEFDPLADFEITTELEDGTKTVSKQTLTSVDTEELEALGYTAVTLDDGGKIYVLYSEGLMEIIDCVGLVKYSIAVEQATSTIMKMGTKNPIVPGSYLFYADVARKAIQSIIYLSIPDRRRWIIEVAQKFHEATDAISKFYELFMNDFNKSIKYAYDKLMILSDNQIEEQEALAAAAGERIKEYTDKIEANKRQRDVMKSNRDFVRNSADIPEDQKQRLIKEYDEEIQKLTNENKHLNGKRAGSNSQLNKANSRISKIKNESSKFRKLHTKIRETIDKFPTKLAKSLRIPKYLRVCGKVAGQLGLPLQCWSLFVDMMDMADDMSAWVPIMDNIDAHHCYKKKDSKAVTLHESIYDRANSHALQHVGIVTSEIAAIAFSLAEGVPGSPTWWAELGFSVVAEVWQHFNNKGSLKDRNQFSQRILALKCKDKDDDDKDRERDKDRKRIYPFPPTNPIHDPSGYVYEAVPANRVEGVQATIYYKETKEDMYGDPYEEIILWDAEEYAQKNPLFTDENGMYQWDVPQGLWQVKFEKDGYATAYSEWLPVPPPQLEVNIGIVQNKQPEVTEARAYEDGVEVQFDKYMDLSTLNTSNIYVTANGEKLNGEVTLVDSSLADEYASEEDTNATRYASRIRFVPEEKLSTTTGEIRLTVSRNVLSYAGIPMTETYSQTLDVEKEVKAIVADDVKVLYGGEKELTISAIPFDAAVNRKLHIDLSSDLIASIDKTEAVLDEEGKATVTIKGDLPGRCQLTFSIDDVTETGDCVVDVVTEIITAEAPKSSRASGTAVYRGTKIELTTESKDATIFFTTDGSCPCDENGTRRKYTVPIVINEDTKILAMASVGNGDDDVSETVEFNYTLKRSDIDFQMEEGWTWISHNLDSPVAPSELSEDENIRRIVGQTSEVVRDPELGLTGNLTSLSATDNYKVQTIAATSRKRLSDIAWNPATPIALKPGWNWVGYPVAQTMTVAEALASTKAETLDVVVGQTGFAQYDGENWTGTLETMTPGAGYMYYSQAGKNLVYNTSIVSKAAAMSTPGIAENCPLAVDIHKYSSVMPTVLTLNNADGVELDNEDYLVAAFSGSECRGLGKTVGGLVMMNVYGESEDPITFLVTDADGETSYANDASLRFSERVVGDLFSPYSIVIGGANGVAEMEYAGNVKVYFDGDMLRISGIGAEDVACVDVFDVKGQKLAHISSIEPAGVRMPTLSDGIYVVVVNGRGEYTYHKAAK